jgi:hypothetical protein
MLAAFAFAGNFDTQQVILSPSGRIGNSLDNPEPDTLQYDDNLTQSYYFNALTNFWSYVRFTPPAAFDLRSIYVALSNTSGNTTPCSLFVYTANGTLPGTLLSRTAIAPQTGSFWYDATLPDTVHLDAAEDFLIVFGRAVGPNGWTPLLDGATSVNRSFVTNANASRMTGPYQSVAVDLRVRVGGSIATFVDMSAEQCYNQVDGGRGLFFMPAGSSVLMKGQAKNLSSAAIDAFTMAWSVRNPSGTEVFSEEVVGTTIAPQATQILSATAPFTVTTPGEYMARCVVLADNDADTQNDTTYQRFFVGGYPRWYRYDDNGDSEGSTYFGEGSATGVSYRPAVYPTRIDTVRVNVSGDDQGQVKIYLNDAQGRPTGEPVWSSPAGVLTGWNDIAVTPVVNIFGGQTFTVAYFYSTTAGLGKDNNPPNEASITLMDTIAWQGDGSTWEGDAIGNWMIQAHLDTTSATPNYSLISTSLDTLAFGPVDTTGSTSAQITFWVYNLGGVDLRVDSMRFKPASIAAVCTVNPTSLVIAAGDSASAVATFNPSRIQAYAGGFVLFNNSNNNRRDSLIVRGSGVRPAAAGDHESVLPSQFSLTQNFPNPFNPSTDIQFSLPVQSHVRLTVYDVLGQEVTTLVNSTLPAGVHTSMFDASRLPTGIYFYRLEAGSFTDIKKMMLMK